MWIISLFVGLLFVIMGCQGPLKQVRLNETRISKNDPPASVEALKSATVVSQDFERKARSPKVHFVELQILAETIAPSGCESVVLVNDFDSEDFAAYLTEFGEVVWTGDQEPNSVINLDFRAIGFDETMLRLSFVDGKPGARVPYQLRLSSLPNQFIRFRYLNRSVDLQLDKTPIYTMSVSEQRGLCEITHNVNIFAKTSGLFNRSKR